MRTLFLLFILGVNASAIQAQYAIIDSAAIDKWPYVGNGRISNDGRYVSYFIANKPVHSLTFIVQAAAGTWRREYQGASQGYFTNDGKKIVVDIGHNSLSLVELGVDTSEYIITSVKQYQVLQNDSDDWLLYIVGEPGKDNGIFLLPLSNPTKVEFIANVESYCYDKERGVLIYQKYEGNVFGSENSVRWRYIQKNKIVLKNDGEDHVIWHGPRNYIISYFVFDARVQQVIFGIYRRSLGYAIGYYNWKDKVARVIDLSRLTKEIHGLKISDRPLQFNKTSNVLFFYMEEYRFPKPSEESVKVDVYSYKDIHLQEEQLRYNLQTRSYLFSMYLTDQVVARLQWEEEQIEGNRRLDETGDLVLMKRGGGPDFWWQKAGRSSVYLVSTRDGTHTLIQEEIPYAHDWASTLNFYLSPSEKFIVYYDPVKRSYFSYEVSTGRRRNITTKISISWKDEGYGTGLADPLAYPIGVAGWLEDDNALWIYDNYDLWQIDPLGLKSPVNITKGYGRVHHIKFRLLVDNVSLTRIIKDSIVYLIAFDPVTKDNGFYSMIHGKDLQRLLMAPYLFYTPGFSRYGYCPIKAKDTNVWIIQRENSEEAPNFYISDDLRVFRQISNICPEKNFNWPKAELIHWKTSGGFTGTGILYKPKDFNPKIKYPVIFNYYEERSNELHEYKMPGFTRDDINIPYFVSRGYLICVPDIRYRIGHVAESVVNYVASAAIFLSSKPWVDAKHMGIQGHSFGGTETIYLLTRTSMFAAAEEGAGASDGLSSYLQLSGDGTSRIKGAEIGQGRKGANLWQRPDVFLKNNAILDADKVTTPLLMMHNKRDGAVPWVQGVELFTALRRLGKRVWWLQYDEGDHFVEGKDAVDYTIRITQFFDHYLKGALPPRWMTEGISARRKGADSGYDLDLSGKVP